MKYSFKKIFITQSSVDDKIVREIQNRYPADIFQTVADTFDFQEELANEDPKKILILTHSKGEIVKACPGTEHSYLCCRYQVINQTLNCPLNCTYCILQFYLNQPGTIIFTDIDKILHEIKDKLKLQQNRFFRIGTGELADSLALSGSRLFAGECIKLFSAIPNALFEIKSKLTYIDKFLDIPNNGNIVFSWSLNPIQIAQKEESMAAGIDDRLKAAQKVQKAGFLTGFHFDPLLADVDYEGHYSTLIEKLYSYVDPAGIAWISIGSLRFPPAMKQKIIERYPKTKIVYGEMIRGMDKKMRYARPVRVPMYRHIYKKLTSVKNPPFIYFCMESAEVWKEVMGFAPESNAHLDFLFADSLFHRFDHLIKKKPDFENYRHALNLDGTEF